jgi:hypothetical protein
MSTQSRKREGPGVRDRVRAAEPTSLPRSIDASVRATSWKVNELLMARIRATFPDRTHRRYAGAVSTVATTVQPTGS